MKMQYWFQSRQKHVDNGKCCVLDSGDGGSGGRPPVAYLGARIPYLEGCASSQIDIVLLLLCSIRRGPSTTNQPPLWTFILLLSFQKVPLLVPFKIGKGYLITIQIK